MSWKYKDERSSHWDGMRDGDTKSVETPFGEAVFRREAGDGLPRVRVAGLVVGRPGFSFDRGALESVTTRVGYVTLSLADALDGWAEGV
jgi:hypothetical protein